MTTVETDRDRLARYANVAGGWVGLSCAGVEVGSNGELRLQSIPDAGVPAGPSLVPPAGDAPAGCALDAEGTGFVSEPDARRVRIVTRCLPHAQPQGDIVGARAGDTELLPGTFSAPRGLLIGPRGRLYVADSDAVVVLDLVTGAITGRWGDVVQGWCLAASEDHVYVLDRGGPAGVGRVRRFDADGVPDTGFGTAVAAHLADPVRMTVAGELLFVVSRAPAKDAVVPIRADGSLDPGTQAAWATPVRTERDSRTGALVTTAVTRITGIAGTSRRVQLVDSAAEDLLTFTTGGSFIGSTRPTRAIRDLWRSGRVLWAYPAENGSLTRHLADGAWLRAGSFVCGPIDTATEQGRRELRVRFDRVPGGHLQLWTAVTPGNLPPSPQTIPVTGVATGTAWSALPVDVDAALVSGPAGPHLFIGGQLGADGMSTPAVHQIGVSGSRSWLDLLPKIYRKDVARSDFLDRCLRLLHSVQAETTQERLDLVRRFDAWTAEDAQDDAGAGVLSELAGWLAVVLDERWPQRTRRAVVANAFVAQAIRGTPKGLRAAIQERFSGVKIEITEPAQRARVWSLGASEAGNSCSCHGVAAGLGFDTMLVAGPAHGAVLGASAVVGQSNLTEGHAAGAPLFEDLAHRFHVAAVPAAGLDATGLETGLRDLIDAEKPAHTVYTLCVTGPRARVGVQARVGIDAIVAGPPVQLDLDPLTAPPLGYSALADGPRDDASTVAGEPAPTLVGALRLGRGRLT